MKMKYISLAALLASAGISQSAVVVWTGSSTSAITSTTEILNVGTAATNITYTSDSWNAPPSADTVAQGAINYGTVSGTINGVDFTHVGGSGDFWSPSTGDATLDNLLGHHKAVGGNGNPWTVVISGLQENTDYQIQIIGIHDERGGGINTRTTSFQSTGGAVSDTLTRGSGGYVIGSFTTGAGETSITIDALGSNDPGASGIVLRAIPEPSSAALVGLGGLSLILRRRK